MQGLGDGLLGGSKERMNHCRPRRLQQRHRGVASLPPTPAVAQRSPVGGKENNGSVGGTGQATGLDDKPGAWMERWAL